MHKAIVAAQMATMVGLAFIFWREGNLKLAAAQLCYVAATGLIFGGP